jgi:hypothetical protein
MFKGAIDRIISINWDRSYLIFSNLPYTNNFHHIKWKFRKPSTPISKLTTLQYMRHRDAVIGGWWPQSYKREP